MVSSNVVRRHRAGALAASMALAMAGCASVASSSVSPAEVSTGSGPASGTAATPASLSGCPPAQPEAALPVLAHLAVSPDDLTVDRAGHIWVTALAAHRITELTASGTVIATLSDPGGPEGIVELPDGRFVVADQETNALSTFAAGVRAPTRLLTLSNHSSNLGVDGIYYDTVAQRLLVPDSPNGTLLAYAVGGATTALVHGLGRPVAATTDPAGNTYIGMENAPGVLMVAPNGATRSLSSFRQVDEVVYLNGLLYVADLAGTVAAVDPASGRTTTLVTAAPEPQGLAATAAGTLLLVDEAARTITTLRPCR